MKIRLAVLFVLFAGPFASAQITTVTCAGTDDHVALQSAFNTGGNLQIPNNCATTVPLTMPVACPNLLGPGTITVPSGAAAITSVIVLSNSTASMGCLIRDITIQANGKAANAVSWARCKECAIEDSYFYDTTSEAVVCGTSSSPTACWEFKAMNNYIEYESSVFTVGNRPNYGLHLMPFATDNKISGLVVKNSAIAAVRLDNGAGNNLINDVHAYGFPLTYASKYTIEDYGGGATALHSSNILRDIYSDGVTTAAIHLGGNGTAIEGGRAYWGDTTTSPNANMVAVEPNITFFVNGMTYVNGNCTNLLTVGTGSHGTAITSSPTCGDNAYFNSY